MGKKKMLIVFIAFLVISAAIITLGSTEKFKGTDEQSQESILEISGDYKPWVTNLWSPKTPQMEIALFSLQAALGGGFIIYYIGRKKHAKDNNLICKDKQAL